MFAATAADDGTDEVFRNLDFLDAGHVVCRRLGRQVLVVGAELGTTFAPLLLIF